MSPSWSQIILLLVWMSVPFVLPCVAVTWALWRSKSDGALVGWPVLVGWIGAALVAMSWGRYWGPFMVMGMICTVEGIAIGGTAVVVKTLIQQSKTKAKHGMNHHQGAQQEGEAESPFKHGE